MNRGLRVLWNCLYVLVFRPTPKALHAWRTALLRLFGASIGRHVTVHPSVKIWAPWNLVMHDYSCLAPHVDCYNCEKVTLEDHAVVSQYSYLCTATHDYSKLDLPLFSKPITIGRFAWVCADVFIGPGVAVGEGAVVGARSSVYKNVVPWTVVAGNPARFLKERPTAERP